MSAKKFHYQNESSNVLYAINHEKSRHNITVFNHGSDRKSNYIANSKKIYSFSIAF